MGSKFNPSDRIAVHKRGKPSQYGIVYKVGENKAHGYYYIDFDNGDRLLVSEKELSTADPLVADVPTPPTIIRQIGDYNRHIGTYKPKQPNHEGQSKSDIVDFERVQPVKTSIPENWVCGCTKHEGLTPNDLNWWESDNKD